MLRTCAEASRSLRAPFGREPGACGGNIGVVIIGMRSSTSGLRVYIWQFRNCARNQFPGELHAALYFPNCPRQDPANLSGARFFVTRQNWAQLLTANFAQR